MIRSGAQLVGLAAKKAAAEAAKADALAISGKQSITLNANPNECPERIGILFDDSGSMQHDKLADAKAGTEEFLRSCKPNETAVAIYCMSDKQFTLSSNLPALAQLLQEITADAMTPLYTRLISLLREQNITRAIVFSDGSPNYGSERDYEIPAITLAVEKKIPVDTVLIGQKGSEAALLLERLAEKTGGIFLAFDPAKSNFRTAFKYLSPGSRYMLADKSFVEKLEGK